MTYGEYLTEMAQTISLQVSLDLNGVLAWRVSDAQAYLESRAYKAHMEAQSAKSQFLADLVKSVNQTTANAAGAVVKSLGR